MGEIASWFERLNTVGDGLLVIIAILTALGFKKWGWPVLAGFGKGVGRFCSGVAAISDLPGYGKLLGKIGAMETSMERVLHEVSPNGGSSMRDAVTTTLATAKRTEVALTLFINSTRAQWDGVGMFGVFECDEQGHYIYTNATYQKWTNRSGKELHGTGWINAIAFADRDAVRREWESCIQDIRECILKYRMRDVSGKEFDVICTATPVREANNGPVVKWVGVIRRNTTGEVQ